MVATCYVGSMRRHPVGAMSPDSPRVSLVRLRRVSHEARAGVLVGHSLRIGPLPVVRRKTAEFDDPANRPKAMPNIPEDIFTEPDDVSPDTLANLGPLRRLAGTWQSDQGVDVSPKVEGPE